MTKKYKLNFGEEQLGKPLLADCILETKSKINVLRADADGNMLISFPKEDEKKVLDFFKGKKIDLKEQKDVVRHDSDLCINCGACISLCPTKAFSFDENNKLVYDEDKCVLCGICVDACPRRALSKPEF
jgi:NAD-dependent dihydropyrimidine dehydrogenase PreA subunit